MKRTIIVKVNGINVVAKIDSAKFLAKGQVLAGYEVEGLRDALADRLQQAVAELPYIQTPRNRVVVQ